MYASASFALNDGCATTGLIAVSKNNSLCGGKDFLEIRRLLHQIFFKFYLLTNFVMEIEVFERIDLQKKSSPPFWLPTTSLKLNCAQKQHGSQILTGLLSIHEVKNWPSCKKCRTPHP